MKLQSPHIIPLSELRDLLRQDQIPLESYYKTIFRLFSSMNGNIKAFLRENLREERVLAYLQQLRDRWPDPESRPPLFGVPFGVKDIYGVDGIPTKAGSRLPAQAIELPQSTVVNRFLAAGAVIFGKTVTTEFAYFQPALTRNPLNLEHTPGGSSSGSAAAVAAGMCPFALGTQTIGSIIRPASYCGVVGFKPSYGRASTHGIFPFSPPMDHPGIICQRLTDLKILAPVLCDVWKPVLISKIPRIGIPHSNYLALATAPALANFHKQVEGFAARGIKIVETAIFEDIDTLEKENHLICSKGFHDTHTELWERYPSVYSTRSTVYILQGRKVSPKLWNNVLANLAQRREGIKDQFSAHGIDLLIAPSTTESAPRGFNGTGSPQMSLPITYHGMPCLTVPSGNDSNGLPFGLQFTAIPGRDEYLVQAAQELIERLRQ